LVDLNLMGAGKKNKSIDCPTNCFNVKYLSVSNFFKEASS